MLGVYEDEDDDSVEGAPTLASSTVLDFSISDDSISLDDVEGEIVHDDFDPGEADRLLDLVRSSFPAASPPPPFAAEETNAGSEIVDDDGEEGDDEFALAAPVETTTTTTTTTMTDQGAVREAKRRKKKLLKNLIMIAKLRDMETGGKILNEEQTSKISKEEMWRSEVESLEHNLR